MTIDHGHVSVVQVCLLVTEGVGTWHLLVSVGVLCDYFSFTVTNSSHYTTPAKGHVCKKVNCLIFLPYVHSDQVCFKNIHKIFKSYYLLFFFFF